MPPKKKSSDGEAPADREATLEAKRLRTRSSPTLLQPHPPPHAGQIPTSLRKSDGADIVKRNANRKKKYLFIFPGVLSLPSTGGKLGSLTSLDTRNPILNIHFPLGTLRLFGTLVFPQNAFISVKPAKNTVQVMDVFETMIVFSEWRWIGDQASNPGGIPVPLPKALKAPKENLWRTTAAKPNVAGGGSDIIHLSSDEESPALADSDEDGWAAAETERVTPLRSNPRRKGRVINYSQLENGESDVENGDISDGEANTDTVGGVKRRTRKNRSQDIDEGLYVVEDGEVEDVKPGRVSGRKRRKVDYSQESDEGGIDENGEISDGKANADTMSGIKRRIRKNESQDIDEDLYVVDDEEVGDVKTGRASRQTRRKVDYSQESDDEGGKDVNGEASDGKANADTMSGVKQRTRKNGSQEIDEDLYVVDDEEVGGVKTGRASRRTRRKVDYSQESGDDEGDDEYVDRYKGGNDTRYEDGARVLRFDDSVELVETVKADEGAIRTRRGSRRRTRRIKYSQESGDEVDSDKDIVVEGGDEDILEID